MSIFVTDKVSDEDFNDLIKNINNSYIEKNRIKIKELLTSLTIKLHEEKVPAKEIVKEIGGLFKLYKDIIKRKKKY